MIDYKHAALICLLIMMNFLLLVSIAVCGAGSVLGAPIDKSDPGAWLADELNLRGTSLDDYVMPKVVSGQQSYNYDQDEIHQKYKNKYEQLNRWVFVEHKFEPALELADSILEDLTPRLDTKGPKDINKVAFNLAFVQYLRAASLSGLDRPVDALLEAQKSKSNCAKSAACPSQGVENLIGWLNQKLAISKPASILGLDAASADLGQAKKAYRGYMLSLHPDKGHSDDEQLRSLKRDLFTKVQEAFKTIQSDGL